MIYDARRDGMLYGEWECVEGSVRFPGAACHTFDATGQRVMFVLWCDTETGELERYKVDGALRFESDKNMRLVKIRETRPAPLTVKVIEQYPAESL